MNRRNHPDKFVEAMLRTPTNIYNPKTQNVIHKNQIEYISPLWHTFGKAVLQMNGGKSMFPFWAHRTKPGFRPYNEGHQVHVGWSLQCGKKTFDKYPEVVTRPTVSDTPETPVTGLGVYSVDMVDIHQVCVACLSRIKLVLIRLKVGSHPLCAV